MRIAFYAVALGCGFSSIALHGQGLPTTTAACAQEADAAVRSVHEGYLQSMRAAMASYQQDGDLDAFLAARDEIRRFEKERTLRKENLIGAPKDLAWLQQFFLDNAFEAAHQVAQKHLGLLAPVQRQLTREGKIDEAIRVRQVAAEIRNQQKDAFEWAAARQKQGGIPSISATSLIGLYRRDAAMADRLLKGKTYLIEGRLADFALDMSNGNVFRISLGDSGVNQLKAQGEFLMSQYDFKSVGAGERMQARIQRVGRDDLLPINLQHGGTFSFSGQIDGKHLNVRIINAQIPESLWKPKPKTP